MVVTTSTTQKMGLPEMMSGLAGLLQADPRGP